MRPSEMIASNNSKMNVKGKIWEKNFLKSIQRKTTQSRSAQR